MTALMRSRIPGLRDEQGELAIDFDHPLFKMNRERGKARVKGVDSGNQRLDR